jgi:uncharacterized Tic20 family protein
MTNATPAVPPPAAMSPEDQRLWATLVHVGGIIAAPWASLVGYLVLRDRGGFIRAHTASALNFNITAIIGVVAGYILSLVIIGIFVLFAVAIVFVIFSILAAVAAHQGQPYKYPLAIEFVR